MKKELHVIRASDGDFTFEYGIVTFKHRFSINRSLGESSAAAKETNANYPQRRPNP